MTPADVDPGNRPHVEVGTGVWLDQAEAAFVLLREHIRRAEDGVFPAALATLTTEQWQAADALRIGCPL